MGCGPWKSACFDNEKPVQTVTIEAFEIGKHEVRVHGREFVFSGGKQQKIIEVLYRAWKMGNPKCRTRAILEGIDSTATSLSHLFSNHPDWKDLIEYSRGFCWLKV